MKRYLHDMPQEVADETFVAMTRVDREDIDTIFGKQVGDVHTEFHYAQDSPTLTDAMEVQDNVEKCHWDTFEEAKKALSELVAYLNEKAVEDGIVGEVATLNGASVVLPITDFNETETRMTTGPRTIQPGDLVPELVMGARGIFSGFFYVVKDLGDSGYGGQIVYRVMMGETEVANGKDTQYATADVGYMTSIEFEPDRYYQQIRDASDLLVSTESDEIRAGVQTLYQLMMQSRSDYDFTTLHQIATLVTRMSVHPELESIRDESLGAIETLLVTAMLPRLSSRPMGVWHTGGLYQDSDDTGTARPQRYRQRADNEPLYLEPTEISEVALLPAETGMVSRTKDKDPLQEPLPREPEPQEPFIVIRNGSHVYTVPFSKITALILE